MQYRQCLGDSLQYRGVAEFLTDVAHYVLLIDRYFCKYIYCMPRTDYSELLILLRPRGSTNRFVETGLVCSNQQTRVLLAIYRENLHSILTNVKELTFLFPSTVLCFVIYWEAWCTGAVHVTGRIQQVLNNVMFKINVASFLKWVQVKNIYIFGDVPVVAWQRVGRVWNTVTIERVSIECRKTQIKVITLAKQKRRRQSSKPIKIRRNYT